MLLILIQLGTHGSIITIELLLNVFHKLESVNLTHLPGFTPILDICQQASDIKEDWHTFKKFRNKLKSCWVFRSKYRYFIDNMGETLKTNPDKLWKTKSKSLPTKI